MNNKINAKKIMIFSITADEDQTFYIIYYKL